MIEWEKGQIDGVLLNKLTKIIDQRGFLCETFRADELIQDLQPVMSYVSYTEPGFTRGPHEHFEQTDMFAILGPANFMVRLWDNRKNSKTYGCYMEAYAGIDNPLLVIIPPGVVHGYKNISALERGMVINYPNRLYRGWEKKEEVDEIRYEADSQSPFKMEE